MTLKLGCTPVKIISRRFLQLIVYGTSKRAITTVPIVHCRLIRRKCKQCVTAKNVIKFCSTVKQSCSFHRTHQYIRRNYNNKHFRPEIFICLSQSHIVLGKLSQLCNRQGDLLEFRQIYSITPKKCLSMPVY